MGYRAYRTPGLAAVTGQPRYRELARRYGPVVAQAGTCACHVHVGVPSRDLGVQAGRHRCRTIRCFKAGTHASHIRPIFGKYYADPLTVFAASLQRPRWRCTAARASRAAAATSVAGRSETGAAIGHSFLSAEFRPGFHTPDDGIIH